jgi:hypothetical protein
LLPVRVNQEQPRLETSSGAKFLFRDSDLQAAVRADLETNHEELATEVAEDTENAKVLMIRPSGYAPMVFRSV